MNKIFKDEAQLNFLFWNTHKNKAINEHLMNTIVDYDCNIVILAEYEDCADSLCLNLSIQNKDFHKAHDIGGCRRIKIFSDHLLDQEILTETAYYTIRNIKYAYGQILLTGVHFPSKLFAGNDETNELAHELTNDILEAEKIVNHRNTIVVGDFNANPFEKSLTNANFLHALSSKELVVKRESRTINAKEYGMFYNPMWNLFGDFEPPNGTYYYANAGLGTYFWNMFDQVIVRPSIAKCFVDTSLRIITYNHKNSFASNNGIPNKEISDHFPIFFSVREEHL